MLIKNKFKSDKIILRSFRKVKKINSKFIPKHRKSIRTNKIFNETNFFFSVFTSCINTLSIILIIYELFNISSTLELFESFQDQLNDPESIKNVHDILEKLDDNSFQQLNNLNESLFKIENLESQSKIVNNLVKNNLNLYEDISSFKDNTEKDYQILDKKIILVFFSVVVLALFYHIT